MLFQTYILIVSTNLNWNQSLTVRDDIVISNEWQILKSDKQKIKNQKHHKSSKPPETPTHKKFMWLLRSLHEAVYSLLRSTLI